MNLVPKNLRPMLIGGIVLLVLAVGIYVAIKGEPEKSGGVMYPPESEQPRVEPPKEEEAVFCTLDAKLCPDGSSVGRTGPNCEFAPCPGETEITNNSTDSAPDGWKIYTKKGFSIATPADFEATDQGERMIVFLKTGPTQKQGTEVYDGIIINFSVEATTKDSLSDAVDAQIAAIEERSPTDLTKPKSPISVNGYQGYTYEETGLGVFTHYVIQSHENSQEYVHLTILVEDPTNQGFQPLVKRILGTLEIKK